jgi:hypothetical protein
MVLEHLERRCDIDENIGVSNNRFDAGSRVSCRAYVQSRTRAKPAVPMHIRRQVSKLLGNMDNYAAIECYTPLSSRNHLIAAAVVIAQGIAALAARNTAA